MAIALALTAQPAAASSTRIKDIADFDTVRSNQLIGYGLVVGLAGTGDRMRNAPFTEAMLQSMLSRMGVRLDAGQARVQNIAAVMVTADLPPFARMGSRIDVQISAMGDATSLQGGTLLATELKGMDSQVYAVAQGSAAITGLKAQGAGASISRGVPTTARIAAGANVEREVPLRFAAADRLRLALRNPDFTTARRVADAINASGLARASAIDPGTVEVTPSAAQPLVTTAAAIETLAIRTDAVARVAISEATGTVVITGDVRVSPVAIAQGGLTISIGENPVASQPAPLSGGETVVLPRTTLTLDEGPVGSLAVVEGASLNQLVGALNRLGVTPRDLIAIVQMLRTAGALQAEVVVQ